VATNKEIITAIYDEMAKGNMRPFGEALASNVTWRVMGTTPWSKTYAGIRAVQEDLTKPLFARFATRYTAVAERIVADGDCVVAEVRGSVTTKSGVAYNNEYCFVFQLENGKIVSITEYCDTALLLLALAEAPDLG